MSTSASAARTFGRNRTPWLSDWLRNCSPRSDSAANTMTTVSEIRTATAITCESDRPRPARSRTSATPQRSAALSRPAIRRPRRSSRAKMRARMIPTTSSSSAPPMRGMKPPSWLPASSRTVAKTNGAISGRRAAGRRSATRSRRPRPRACRRSPVACRSRAGSARAAPRSPRTPGRSPDGPPPAAPGAPRAAAPRAWWVRRCRRSFGQLPVVGVRPQHLDEVASCPEQAHLHRAERRLRDVGDLLVAESLDVAQDERDPGLGGQAAKLALEPRDPLAALEALGRQLRDRLLRIVHDVLDRLGAPARDVVDRGVVGDLQQPRAERGVGAEPPEAMERPQERVLADVLGLLAARDPGGDPDDDVAMALHQRLERVEVAAQRRLHVGVVGVRGDARHNVAGHANPFPRPPDDANPQLTDVWDRQAR